jgi:hypothetical protein
MLLQRSFTPINHRNTTIVDLLSAAALAAVGNPSPALPLPPQGYPQVRLDLLKLLHPLDLAASESLRRNIAILLPVPCSPPAKDYIALIQKVLGSFLQNSLSLSNLFQ